MGAYGNNRPVYWALPIINFVFWAGVALSGTMISAILRLLHAGWRRSLTRMTETLTICALAVAGVFPLLHIGRNWIFYWMLPYPNERAALAELQKPAALGRVGDLGLFDHQRHVLVCRTDPGLCDPAGADYRLAACCSIPPCVSAGAARTGSGGG